MKLKKISNYFLLLICCFTFIFLACKNKETDLDQNYGWQQQRFSFSIENMTTANETLNSVSAFIFQNNKLVSVNPDLTLNNGECAFPVIKDVSIYFVANLPVSYLSAITTGMTLEDFLVVRHNESDPATLFFVGHTTITTTSSTTLPISLTRSLVSFNLNTDSDQYIKVSKINFTQLPTSTTIWENKVISAASSFHEAELVYATAIGTTEDVFRCYESATPIQMTIEVTYKGMLRTVEMAVQSIKRNHKYTIKLTGIGETIVVSFEILPWEDGGAIELNN